MIYQGTVGGGGSILFTDLLCLVWMKLLVNEFFLEYIARPQTAEIFFEDITYEACFMGMRYLRNNKLGFISFKNRGYRGVSMNRPDKIYNKLSKTERAWRDTYSSEEDKTSSRSRYRVIYRETRWLI
jgi:hypothetical protein